MHASFVVISPRQPRSRRQSATAAKDNAIAYLEEIRAAC
jgi:hypothetical protein